MDHAYRQTEKRTSNRQPSRVPSQVRARNRELPGERIQGRYSAAGARLHAYGESRTIVGFLAHERLRFPPPSPSSRAKSSRPECRQSRPPSHSPRQEKHGRHQPPSRRDLRTSDSFIQGQSPLSTPHNPVREKFTMSMTLAHGAAQQRRASLTTRPGANGLNPGPARDPQRRRADVRFEHKTRNPH